MKRKLKYGLILAVISGFLPLSTLLAGQCPSNIDAIAQDYRDQGYTVFHCQSNASGPNALDPVNDTFNAQICGSGSGVTIEVSQIGDPLNKGPEQVTVYNIKSTGGSVDNQQTQPWGGFTNINIECKGDYHIAYQFTDEMANEDPTSFLCCPAGETCDMPNLPVCPSHGDSSTPTDSNNQSDPNDQNINPDTEESSNPNTGNTIDSVDYKGTIFQGGRGGKDTDLFASKKINNVTFTDITIELANKNDRDWGMVFNGSAITNTIFKDNDELPTLLFQRATLDEVKFQKTTLFSPVFMTSNMKKVEFQNSVLLRPDFYGVDLRNTIFEDTIICDANLTDATYEQSTFKGATVYKAYYADNGLWTAANIDNNIVEDSQAPKECQNYN
jgi:uncharacterized protein YjbI with pentapeptide repeats